MIKKEEINVRNAQKDIIATNLQFKIMHYVLKDTIAHLEVLGKF